MHMNIGGKFSSSKSNVQSKCLGPYEFTHHQRGRHTSLRYVYTYSRAPTHGSTEVYLLLSSSEIFSAAREKQHENIGLRHQECLTHNVIVISRWNNKVSMGCEDGRVMQL
jgi:uncharacterized protein YjlB